MSLDPIVGKAISALFSLIFLTGAWDKLRDRHVFAGVVQGYEVLPAAWAFAASLLIATVELFLGLFLLFPGAVPAAPWLGLGFLSMVTAVLVINLLRGRTDLDCGCGGASADQQISWGLVARNLGLGMLLGLAGAHSTLRDTGWADVLLTIFAAVTAFGLYAAANQLLSNYPRLRQLEFS